MDSPATKFPREDSGLLIAVEGIDGSGKTTQCNLLNEWLEKQGYSVLRLAEPSKGEYGQEIRRLAHAGRLEPRREYELFLLDREDDVATNILPGLKRGKIVLMDRYYLSSMAYQGALGIPVEEIEEANERIAPRPDLVLLMKISPEVSLARVQKREEGGAGPNLFEQIDYQKKVAAEFDKIEWPEIQRIDATQSIADIHQLIRAHVKSLLQKRWA